MRPKIRHSAAYIVFIIPIERENCKCCAKILARHARSAQKMRAPAIFADAHGRRNAETAPKGRTPEGALPTSWRYLIFYPRSIKLRFHKICYIPGFIVSRFGQFVLHKIPLIDTFRLFVLPAKRISFSLRFVGRIFDRSSSFKIIDKEISVIRRTLVIKQI